MLITSKQLNNLYETSCLDILNNSTYLTEHEAILNTIEVPILENTRLGVNTVYYKDIEKICENHNCYPHEALKIIAESSNVDENSICVSIDESDIILDQSITKEFPQYVIIPESEYSIPSIFVEACIYNYIINDLDEDFLYILSNPDLMLLEDTNNVLGIDLNNIGKPSSSFGGFSLNNPQKTTFIRNNNQASNKKMEELLNKATKLQQKNRILNGATSESEAETKKYILSKLTGSNTDKLVKLNNIITELEEKNNKAEQTNEVIMDKAKKVKNTSENIDTNNKNNSELNQQQPTGNNKKPQQQPIGNNKKPQQQSTRNNNKSQQQNTQTSEPEPQPQQQSTRNNNKSQQQNTQTSEPEPQPQQQSTRNNNKSQQQNTGNITDPKNPSFVENMKKYLINKPKDFLAKMAAKLRNVYKNWLDKANSEANSGNASWYKKIARKIIQTIDWIMQKIENLKSNNDISK